MLGVSKKTKFLFFLFIFECALFFSQENVTAQTNSDVGLENSTEEINVTQEDEVKVEQEEQSENDSTKKKETTFINDKTSFVGKSWFSVDTSYLWNGIKNHGLGIGATYEYQFLKLFSLRPAFSYSIFLPFYEDGPVISAVGLKLDLLLYPFKDGLDKFYVGAGMGTDFIMSNDETLAKEARRNTLISVSPFLGWKQNILNWVALDLFFGYRFVINESDVPIQTQYYAQSRFEYGIKFKVNLGRIIDELFAIWKNR